MFKHKAFTSTIALAGITLAAVVTYNSLKIAVEDKIEIAASVSVCMENSAVADKIEITKTAIKKASIAAIGMDELLSFDELATCDIKLV